jgi:hypothetical protein
LFLSRDGGENFAEVFKVDETRGVVLRREAAEAFLAVLPHALLQIASDASVQGARFAGHDVDGVRFHWPDGEKMANANAGVNRSRVQLQGQKIEARFFDCAGRRGNREA